MPYRSRDIYRGRRKGRIPLMIFLFFLAFVLVGGIVAFYGLQQFIVYDQDSVRLQFHKEEPAAQAETPAATPIPTPDVSGMNVTIVFQDPNFDEVALDVGEDMTNIRAAMIPFADCLDTVKLAAGVSSALEKGCNAVVLELKTEAGQLAWTTSSEYANSYGTGGLVDLSSTLSSIHEQGLYAIAKISVCADNIMAIRNWTLALLDGGGLPYQDENEIYWLDPYNKELRTYIISLMQELSSLGFDEILLDDLCHPIAGEGESFNYSVTLRSDPNPRAAVCQLALKLCEAMQGSETKVSVLLDSGSLDEGIAALNGQDPDVFWRIFDRLYCPCSVDGAADTQSQCLAYGGSAERFVPYTGLSTPEGLDGYLFALPETKEE